MSQTNIDNDRRDAVRVSGRSLFAFKVVDQDSYEGVKADYETGISLYTQEHLLDLQVFIGVQKALANIREKDEAATFSLKKIYDENRMIIKEILDECISQDKIRPVNTELAASVILGAMDGEMIQWITDPNFIPVEESFNTMVEIILNGLKK